MEKVVAKNDKGEQLIPLVCPHGYETSCQSSSGDSICGEFCGSEEVFGNFHIVNCGGDGSPNEEPEPDPAPKTIRTDIYVHSCKETMWELGEKLGLKEVALQMFRHAASEVKLTLEVDEECGLVTIVAVDGRELKP